MKSTAQLVTDADCDCGRYYSVLITFPNVSMMYPIIWDYIAVDMAFVLKCLWPLVAKNFVCLIKQSK